MACNDRSISTDESPTRADPVVSFGRSNCYELLTRLPRRSVGAKQVVVTMLIAVWGAPACGGDVGYVFSETGGSDSGSGGAPPRASGGSATGGNPFIPSTGGQAPGVGGTLPYEEVECPDDVLPPPTLHECDPFYSELGCYAFEACLPYILYPDSEDGCGVPGYGEVCIYAGIGQQGALCSDSGTGCSPGFMCVVGAAGGERCAQICVPGQTDTCPPGLICGETDVLGYGVCY